MDWKTVIAATAALGALTTGLTNLVRWWRERSTSHKILDEMNRAAQLERFLRAASRMAGDGSRLSVLPALVEKANAELDVTLSSLASAFDRRTALRSQDSEMSFLRNWFLLYKPLGIRAVFAHFLFYCSVILMLMFALSYVLLFGFDDNDSFSLRTSFKAAAAASPVLLSWFAVPCSLNYWATVEHRWRVQPAITPGKLASALLWYTPVSNGEVLARMVILVSACNWLASRMPIYPYFGLDLGAVAREVSGYQLVCRFSLGTLTYPVAMLVGYMWARAELRVYEHGGAKPRFPRNLRFLYTPRGLEGWTSLLVFYVLAADIAAHALLLVPTYKRLSEHLQSFLPSDVYSSTVVGLYVGGILAFLISDLLPLYGAYRWGLAAYRSHTRDQPARQEMIGTPSKA